MTEAKVHQLLHGYRSGHEQIATSVKLTGRDSELVTRLSDLSGSLSSGLQINPYLTVYPLPSRKYFALARTWPDPDAPRAGCVITHTLLIPMNSWARFANVRSVNSLFRNLRSVPEYNFGQPLNLPTDTAATLLDNAKIDLGASKAFVSRYFGKGMRPIVWFNAEEPEEYLWRLLEHLWPQLRCAFSCCTFSLQQRILEDSPFDLLFAPATVYSRFTKLALEHLIEPTSKGNNNQLASESWCQYWAEAFFSAMPGLPSMETELPLWNELGEDPTAVRKLSLVHELRLRASQSPTAGVGAIDVIESLALDPETALPLKRLVIINAINAAENAQTPEDALTCLQLIDDRLRRESFRSITDDFKKRLMTATARVTEREPETAIQAGGKWLANSMSGTNSAFVHGVIFGLRAIANTDPSRLKILHSYPDIAMEIFRLEPTFAVTYLQVGGDAAPHVLATWLSSIRDTETLRLLRKSILPSLRQLGDKSLLSPLLSDLQSQEVKETLNRLSEISNNFENHTVQNVIADQLSPAYPELVREWASENPIWSSGTSAIVASTYPQGRHGFNEFLEHTKLSADRQAEVLAVMILNEMKNGCPYWLREVISKDVRIIRTLLSSGSNTSELVENGLSRMLNEVTDLPLANSVDLLSVVLAFENRPEFHQLLDFAMRSVITHYISDGTDTIETRSFLNNTNAIGWLKNVPGPRLTSLVIQACHSGPHAVARAWKWISAAPPAFFHRYPSVLPELCNALLRYTWQSFPEGVQESFIQVLIRSRSESNTEVRQSLSTKMLRFALDNVSFPLGAVVAEAFADVYSVALKKDSQSSSFFSILFGSHNWDRAKDLRISVIDAFLRSNWSPGDLALAASNAGILRKIFKRLHRKTRGDYYLSTMLQDLSLRSDLASLNVFNHLKELMESPNFYEEWD